MTLLRSHDAKSTCPACIGHWQERKRCALCHGSGVKGVRVRVVPQIVEKIVVQEKIVEKIVYRDPPKRRYTKGGGNTRLRRLADALCVDCESPNLGTGVRCVACERKKRQRERLSI